LASLAACQRSLLDALLDPNSEVRAGVFNGGPDLVRRRISVYRGNVVAGVTKALSISHPVCLQVVGEEFFGGLVRAYWAQIPSRSGDLNEYGETFGTFLERFDPVTELPYLPDLARLEWLVHAAGRAADGIAVQSEELVAMAADRLDSLCLAFAPGTALLASRYPVARIWRIHQNDYDGEFAIDFGQEESVLVARVAEHVGVTSLSPGQFAIAARLLSGGTLLESLDDVQAADVNCDYQLALAQFLAVTTVCGAYCRDQGESE